MRYLIITSLVLLAGCGNMPARNQATIQKISDELKQAAEPLPAKKVPDAVASALLPPLKASMPKVSAKQLEQRFDLVVSEAPANQVLMGIVSGTRYSMLVHPDIKGTISVNLKDVTLFEALDAVRKLYGYEYKVEGTRVMVEPSVMQTRVFQVNYITGQRQGASDMRVTTGSVNRGRSGGSGGGDSGASGSSGSSGGSSSASVISSRVETNTATDFWADLQSSLNGIVGAEEGRKVIINPQSGVVVVRGMPNDIRNVEKFLRVMQLNIERQVILEAKIINVQLNDSSQNGVNWSLFGRVSNNKFSVGNVNNDTTLNRRGGGTVSSGDLSATAGSILANASTSALGGPLFALAFQGANFAAMLTFLESQGDVQVLSSPRIATINNQKAVLKVGTDEFFVTGVSTSTTASTGATTTMPEVTLQPFFSGIALDVTPQIDQDDNIILHIHPSVSQVTTVNKQISLGSALSSINLPLALSNISETDSIVRTRDGQVIAIGGLMTETASGEHSKVPGLGDSKTVGKLFRQNAKTTNKAELIILLKSTVVQSSQDWAEDILASQRRVQDMMDAPSVTER